MQFCEEAVRVLSKIEQEERFSVDVESYFDDDDVFVTDESMIEEFGRVLSDEERLSACYFVVYNSDGIVGETGIGYTDRAQCRKDAMEALEEALVDRARKLGLWNPEWEEQETISPGY